MAISIVRLGSPRAHREGIRLGTVRRPPRGVPKAAYSSRDYFDVWFPELAPSTKLFTWARSEPFTEKRWIKFAKDYTGEMEEPSRQRIIQLLARLSHQTNFSVGCYCELERGCHRSILRKLLRDHGAIFAE